jgi:hypothetical protein
LHSGDPSIWPGSRGPDFQDFTFNLQSLTGPDRIWPFKLAASPHDATGERHAAFDQEAHGDRSWPPSVDSVANRIIISSEGEVMRNVNMDVTRWR